MEERNLQAIDGATLMGLHLEPTRFCVDTLLPQGGVLPGRGVQDWQVLDGAGLVRPHRQGGAGVGPAHPEGDHPVPVFGGTPSARVQDRLNRITEEVPGNAYFSAQAETHGRRPCWRRSAALWGQHPDTVLVVVDTFAVVRALGGDQTYGSDYQRCAS